MGNNTILRPPLAELLASNDDLTCAEVQLLLKYGAKVSFFFFYLRVFGQALFYKLCGAKNHTRDRFIGLINKLQKIFRMNSRGSSVLA